MILLDTHVAVWLTTDKSLLSANAASAIRRSLRSGEGAAIASSSLWEVAMMSTRRNFQLASTLREYLHHLESMFVVLPITGAIAERSMLFDGGFPRDPTDRIIAATAVVHGIRMVTKDKPIRSSGQVECIW